MADEPVADQAYDEAIPVETDDEEVSTPGTSEAGTPKAPAERPAQAAGGREKSGAAASESGDSESSEGSTSESSDEGGGKKSANMPAGAYNPDEFKGVKVSSEIEELFNCITRYKPHTIELDTVLKPFIPELIPSIGEVDAFLKMPRPDGAPSGLGTACLDEPTLNPSDPSILDLQLRSLSKNQDLQPMEVRSIENAEKNPKEIDNWVKRIDSLNRSKPAPTVQYSRRMPDIEQLMQVWPAEFEEYLQNNPLPELADLELDLPSYIRIFASILDVPVYSQITETLHVIFTLYSEFKSNQHFSKTDTAGNFGDQYNFGPVPATFGQPGAAQASTATAPVFGGGPTTESMAPSRAPSPVRQGPQ
ncbi:ift46 [Symbiodinium sp. CCMP2456]|nr:ift46 [Symbiodinium sp. CCMP2456]